EFMGTAHIIVSIKVSKRTAKMRNKKDIKRLV
uniref:Uncharacterized protein n=1 Tax=Amphimedon queenslandica TaxID=400682 RepID=A0A1X7V0H7_AMPQE